MSRTYQVNPGFQASASSSLASIGHGLGNSHGHQSAANSTAELFDEEDEPRSKWSRYLGIAFLLALVALSITFLTFAIFYDEIFDDDGETAEEYWKRVQKEIRQMQEQTREEIYNRTLEKALEANQSINVLMSVPKNSKPGITFDHYIGHEFTPEGFDGKWISDNELLHYDDDNNLCVTTVPHMNKTVLIPYQTIQRYRLYGLSLSPDRKYFLAVYNTHNLYRYTSLSKYRIFCLNDSSLSPPLIAPEFPREVLIHYAEWGPTGSQLVFVARNDIFYKSDVMSEPIRLTRTGKETVIFNGVPDWVYEEEIIEGPKTFWFSPDGSKLVYATINDTLVDLMTWPYYGARNDINGFYNQYPRIQSVRYPKPGRNNPIVSLYYIPLSEIGYWNTSQELAQNIRQLTVYLKPVEEIRRLGDYYFTTFEWIDNDWLAVNWMNRAQNFSVVTLYSNKNKFEPVPNFRLQSNNGWIDLFHPPVLSPDRSSYLLKVPKMSDNKKQIFSHVVRVSVTSAKSDFLSAGMFEVKKILTTNAQTQRVYFTATYPSSPGSRHLLSVPLNQTLSAPVCHTCLINNYHSGQKRNYLFSDAIFSPNGHYYILYCEGPTLPIVELRRTVDDGLVYTIEDNEDLADRLKGLALPKTILMKVPVGKYKIDVQLIVPEEFAENTTQRYPLIINVYGGPGSDTGAVTQRYFYNQFSAFMASNRSVIYALVDARGSPNHGCKFMFDVYRKLGSVEVEDVVAVADYLKYNTSFVEPNGVAIWGWSYGGYLTTMALAMDRDNSVFNCGVAVAPVSDWLYYDSVYVERFMGFPTPEDNLNSYLSSSTLDKVQYLRGKQFLVMFGTGDDNVHAMNAMMLMRALNQHSIQYETHVFPDANHGLQNSQHYVYQRMTKFFDKCFGRDGRQRLG